MNTSTLKIALAFSLSLMLVSGFVILYLAAGYRGAIQLEGKIVEFKAGAVPVITFDTPNGKRMHFSDALGSVPRGAKQGDSITIRYVPRNGKARISQTSTIEWAIYFFFTIGVVGLISILGIVVLNPRGPKQGIGGLYGR